MSIRADIIIPEDVYNDIKERREKGKFNLSGFCTQAYRSAFMDDIQLIKKYNETMKLALEMKKIIEDKKARIRKEEEAYKIFLKSDPQLEVMEFRFLVSAKRKISKDRKYLEPNYTSYCGTFMHINKEMFIKKLDRIDLDKCADIPAYETYEIARS